MTQPWRVRAAAPADRAAWATLRAQLWPEQPLAELAADLDGWFEDARLAAFIAEDGEGVCGFAEASLRSDYVNGTESSPVAFLEGWYVAPSHRGRGVGRALVATVEAWGRERGCRELASDALLDNLDSHRAHAACGFEETERVVYFRRRLDAQ
ncbi:aminoglycoside 6'-N-acetyltransferase [Lysobacter enzymogenes]|uniref:Aminoglycoside N(6')-acetyltransferase type 1 n=1 Tax=Lysobacter enzymogenes TaxID=69 RepID=A0A0S2DDB2_LYSEN|nr:aminoglycoside 6'-N-acetyltransferase [Lysobacter enzymogenes]ALN56513.1 aminoglycoside 6'-N-acetyltransferase [Lysobacter enzymogenes]